MGGRVAVGDWIRPTTSACPGSHMVAFPTWRSVIDERTGRSILELDHPMRDPGDGSVIGEPNISIIAYAGDGLWRQQEDIYNPLRFVQATMKWCRKAAELGTLDEAGAQFMEQYGGAQQ